MAELPGQKAEVGDTATLQRLRRYLLALFVLVVVATFAELLLAKHTEDLPQFIPFFLLGLSLALLALYGALRRRWGLRAFQVLMILFVAGGMTGSVLHYRGKTEFALERQPDLTGLALFREALKGTNPPLLAPGAMIALGLLGLIWTYRHPDLTGADA
jgi:4-hydroxybenzoate polyprenyltransferase